jgi:CDP-diacylglycerol--serine O-phosphatidyltransferase
LDFNALWIQGLNAATMVIIGLLMISNLKYYSFKVMDRKRVPFVIMIPVILIFSAITYNIPVGILIISVIYALSGIATTLMSRKQTA